MTARGIPALASCKAHNLPVSKEMYPNVIISTLRVKIKDVEKSLSQIAEIKDNAIVNLEEMKKFLRRCHQTTNKQKGFYVPNARKVLGVWHLDKNTNLLDQEISSLQDKYTNLKNDLEQLMKILEDKIAMIDKTNVLLNIINFKIYENKFELSKKLTDLKMEHNLLRTNEIDTERNIKIAEILKEIKEIQENYMAQINSMEEQKREIYLENENVVSIIEKYKEVNKKFFKDLKTSIANELPKRNLQVLKNIENYDPMEIINWDELLLSNHIPGTDNLVLYFKYFCYIFLANDYQHI